MSVCRVASDGGAQLFRLRRPKNVIKRSARRAPCMHGKWRRKKRGAEIRSSPFGFCLVTRHRITRSSVAPVFFRTRAVRLFFRLRSHSAGRKIERRYGCTEPIENRLQPDNRRDTKNTLRYMKANYENASTILLSAEEKEAFFCVR